MSDPLPENDTQWQPLSPEKVASAAQESNTDETFNEFKMLYGVSDTQSPGAAFIPLYGSPREAHPAPGKEVDPALSSDESESDAESIRKKAYDDGFAEGEKKGFAARKEDADDMVTRMQSILSEMEGIWKQLIETYEQQMIQLICRVSEKIVFGHIAMDQEVIKRAILQAFQMIPEPVDVTIEVNSEDAEYIETIKEDFFSQLKTLKHISVIANPSVTRGGCMVKTLLGEVDATLESRLEAIRETIINVGKNKGKDGHSTKS